MIDVAEPAADPTILVGAALDLGEILDEIGIAAPAQLLVEQDEKGRLALDTSGGRCTRLPTQQIGTGNLLEQHDADVRFGDRAFLGEDPGDVAAALPVHREGQFNGRALVEPLGAACQLLPETGRIGIVQLLQGRVEAAD